MQSNKSDIHLVLSNNTRTARLRLGYSQQELAERANLSTGHINDIEQSRKWLSADSLQRLADALGLEPFMLLLPGNGGPGPDSGNPEAQAWYLLMDFSLQLRERITEAVDEVVHTTRRELLQQADFSQQPLTARPRTPDDTH
ncbi:helix-turn-helix domain-containing protein [Spirochaeta africana]|uniref:Putative transcriptional regulator n=1 Tax=Spirochaeta africana (strain ATCC 700263 / DSM 8902 / Z-7692) TaxID=889378 RepID=H9UGE6_SPIAZ|nr:helix-turn-helix domain-containing protein [Spirochaeta africana]AFG36589.1 putative transcriptional regulator [Spirochaeta africana DSM 8902]